jgi:hypothetical protein
MSRPTGSKNKEAPPKIIQADDTERLEYLATLLLEIAEEELRESKVVICSQN